ncbi:BLUF domain-containing protein [Parasphingopyxis algicola]|uniref:BLUF domain-containing protein n=1 Tax=Parasphingopyxis algicola TaxID=2026624 RepID=UPI0015A0E34C|nr:BLUF domain-containing protein [Parasphingopyxis algicola]QLC23847.1 BLUF domain-containing protein [Parasphingopyxis algicola]
MYRLTYVSTVRPDIGQADFDDILIEARASNFANRVTGLLICDGRFFFQYLEGTEAAVEATFDRIGRDARHFALAVLARGPTGGRRFPGWDMAFENVEGGVSFSEAVFESIANFGSDAAAALIDYIRAADRAA